MKGILVFIFLTVSAGVSANSVGYIFEGKTYYQFKNGKALNEMPEAKRTPASINDSGRSNNSKILYFTEDDFARCYYWEPEKDSKEKKNIHCLKKEK